MAVYLYESGFTGTSVNVRDNTRVISQMTRLHQPVGTILDGWLAGNALSMLLGVSFSQYYEDEGVRLS